MDWHIDNDRPVYIQIIEQIKMKIISGEIELDSRIDSVRNLAEDAKVNPNTMQKALTQLEQQGFLYSKRTSGRFVTNDKSIIDKERKLLAKDTIEKSINTLIGLGYKKEDVLDLIEEVLNGEV